MRMVNLTPLDESPRWFFNSGIDLEVWLPAITNHPGDGQDNDGALVAGFHAEFAPSEKHGRLMAASREMYVLLKAGLPQLKDAALASGDDPLVALCDQMAQRMAEIDAAPGHEGPDRPAW
jgi:hypothetical protein